MAAYQRKDSVEEGEVLEEEDEETIQELEVAKRYSSSVYHISLYTLVYICYTFQTIVLLLY